MIKLIAIDLDGTSYRRISLSKSNIEALTGPMKPAMILLSRTGRPLAGVRPIFEEIGLPDGNYLYDYQ